jgi:hypothetical protein
LKFLILKFTINVDKDESISFQRSYQLGQWWLRPIMLASWEAEISSIMVPCQPWKNLHRLPLQWKKPGLQFSLAKSEPISKISRAKGAGSTCLASAKP